MASPLTQRRPVAAVHAQPTLPRNPNRAKQIATKVLFILFGGSVIWTIVWIGVGLWLSSDDAMGAIIAFYWWVIGMVLVVPAMLVLLFALSFRPDAWE
jgi:hypothetical protein